MRQILSLALFAALLAALGAGPAFADEPAAVTINGTAIPASEYQAIYTQLQQQYQQTYGVDFASEQGQKLAGDLRQHLTAQLVERQLVRDEARARGLAVTDEQVATRLAEVKKEAGGEALFTQALEANHVTLETLSGRIRDGLTFEAVIEALTHGVAVDEAAVAGYYRAHLDQFKQGEEVRVSHILVDTEKQAKDLLAQLKKGGDFAKLAKAHSQDPGSKVQGGDLGFFGRGMMVPAFEKAAFALKPNQLSGLVKTQFGYHILKGRERHPGRTRPLAEVKAELTEQLMHEAKNTTLKQWLEAAKQKAQVLYSEGYAPAP